MYERLSGLVKQSYLILSPSRLFDTLHSAFLYTSLDHYFVKFFSTPES